MSSHVSLVTMNRSLSLASTGTNITCATSAIAQYSSATKPITTTATASGWAVMEGDMNYVKILPLFVTCTSPAMRVIGWSLNSNSGLYCPALLCDVSFTLNVSDTQTINGTASLLGSSAITKNIGDCKIFNSTSLGTSAFFVVDTLGCQLVQFSFRATTGVACNANIGSL